MQPNISYQFAKDHELDKPENKCSELNQGYLTLLEQFGPVIRAALKSANVEEIMLNEDGSLFVESKLTGMEKVGNLSANTTKAIIRTLASLLEQELDLNCPIISGEIPNQNARFEGMLPPLAIGPCFCIRKHNPLDISLDNLVSSSMMTTNQAILLRHAMYEHKNILIAGATGSGKTTLANALLNEVSILQPTERIISIEDTPELNIKSENKIKLFSNKEISLATLLKSVLRLRPDRIVVGEIRGAEALDLLDAFSTGHSGGLSTIHAGNVQQALQRLCLLISRNAQAPKHIEPLIAQALDLIVFIDRIEYRKIKQIVQVKDYQNQHFVLQDWTNEDYYKEAKAKKETQKANPA